MALPAPLTTSETLACATDDTPRGARAGDGRPPPDAETRDADKKRPTDEPAPAFSPEAPQDRRKLLLGGQRRREPGRRVERRRHVRRDGRRPIIDIAPGAGRAHAHARRARRAEHYNNCRRSARAVHAGRGRLVHRAPLPAAGPSSGRVRGGRGPERAWQAFAQMQTRLYAFVFLDIEMPVMNGYRCAQAIRRWEARVEQEQKQFICALTSHAQPDGGELGLGIGVQTSSRPSRPSRSVPGHRRAGARRGVDVERALGGRPDAAAATRQGAPRRPAPRCSRTRRPRRRSAT